MSEAKHTPGIKIPEVEVCTIADIGFEITGSDAPLLIAAINKYLSVFAKPVRRNGGAEFVVGSHECLKCGKPLSGLLGTFQWGLVNGEGSCSECGWPARAYHEPADDEGKIFDRILEIVLQYHPDNVTATNKGAPA